MKKLFVFVAILLLFASRVAAFDGGMVYKYDTNQITADNVWEFVTFSHVLYDTRGFYSALYPTRITIPAGVEKVVLKAQVIFTGNPTGLRQLVIKKNYPTDGGWFPGVPAQTMVANTRTTTDVQVFTAPIPVTTGDFFELEAFQCSGGNLNVLASVGTWFSVEVVE